MRVWLVTIGEPVPLRGDSSERLHRTGYFARFLAARGHQVVWWTSAFDHFRKTFVAGGEGKAVPWPGLEVRLLRGCGYSRNVSLARIRDHKMVAAQFSVQSRRTGAPEVILCSFPTLELSEECVKYGEDSGVPVILDMRDMWPDIFTYLAPAVLRPLVRAAMGPMYRSCAGIFARASAITGITDEFVDWGVARAGRARRVRDKSFFMGYSAVPPGEEELRKADAFWNSRGILAGGPLTACFLGTLGRQLDVVSVIEAARVLNGRGAKWRFVICGTGDKAEELKALANGLPNVSFPGWVDRAQIYVLMRRCSVGLDPLPCRFDFLATVNNKAIEYLSAGLPVVSSPAEGALFRLLSAHNCGISSPANDGGALAAAIAGLGPRELSEMSRNAVALYEDRFVAEKVYADFAEYLAEAAGARGR